MKKEREYSVEIYDLETGEVLERYLLDNGELGDPNRASYTDDGIIIEELLFSINDHHTQITLDIIADKKYYKTPIKDLEDWTRVRYVEYFPEGHLENKNKGFNAVCPPELYKDDYQFNYIFWNPKKHGARALVDGVERASLKLNGRK